jgi:type II secretory pathway component GspD/PulD (secretin)
MNANLGRWVLAIGVSVATSGIVSAQEAGKPEERRFQFEIRNKPWAATFAWLADNAQLPFVAGAQPTGTFNFVPANGDKQYSLGEIIDILNEALIPRKFVLLRRPTSITLLPADERIDPTMVPRVSIDELGRRGKTEIVSVLLPVKTVQAKDFAPEIKKLLGPFGEVIALAKANQLVVQDAAGNLRRVIETVQAIEERETTPAQPKQKAKPADPPVLRTYPVPGGNASAIVKLLQDVHKNSPHFRITALGPNSILVYAPPDEQVELARHLTDGARIITELISLNALDAGRTAETLKQMFGDAKAGGPFVEAETDRNALIVRGTVTQLQDIKEVLTALGEGGAKGGVRTFSMHAGSAATMAEGLQKMMSEMRPNLSVKIVAPGKTGGEKKSPAAAKGEAVVTITAMGNRIIVASDDAQALALATELFRLLTAAPGDPDFEVVRLRYAMARDVARVLDEAFNGSGGGGRGAGIGMPRGERVRIVADQATNSLLIKASPLDTMTIRRLLTSALDIEGAGDAPDAGPKQKRGPGKKGAD